MIIGHLNTLPLAGLPPALYAILARPDCTLAALSAREDGRWQPEGADWYCNLGNARTQPRSLRHTEYHNDWLDIQVVLAGEEQIYADPRPDIHPGDSEKKPDLFIVENPRLTQCLGLSAGVFAVFFPGEPHQALCAPGEEQTVRKAVFKVPRTLLDGVSL